MKRELSFLFLFLFFAVGFTRPVIPRADGSFLTKKEANEIKPKQDHQPTRFEDDQDVPNSEEDGSYYFKDPSYHLQWHLQNLGFVEGEDLVDLAVVPAWEAGYSGDGVTVAVVDSKMDHYLPDLKDNIDATLSKDFNFGIKTTNYPDHAPAVAGLIGAVAGNQYCGAGVAFHSSLALLRLLDGNVSDATEASALTWKSDDIDIYSCNWGPSDDGDTLEGPGPLSAAALEEGTTSGRNGKGSVYVWAAGNGGKNDDNCNYDGYANSPYTIAVGSINSYGQYSSFSEPCSAMLTTAPGGEDNDKLVGITTTDSEDCSSEFTGTDYAAPQVAGVVALMLQANPSLNWRDVQTILIQSSRIMLNGEEKGVNGWQENAAGYFHHDHYGFGLLNASKAVFLAKNWVKNSLRTRFCFNSSQIRVNQEIPQNGTTVSTFWKIAEVTYSVEHVRVFFSATHSAWGDLSINLTSPSGTVSKLATTHAQKSKGSGSPSPQYQEWPFMTVKNWGENPSGNWFLTVGDEVDDGYSGQFDTWQLEVCGYYPSSAVTPTPTPAPIYQTDNTPIVETEYEENRSFSQQLAAIFWRFLIVISILGGVIIAAAVFVSPRSFESWFGSFSRRGQRDNEGIFDPGDDL